MDRRLSGWQLLLDASQFDGQDLVPWSVDPKSSYRRLYPSEMVQIGLVDGVCVVGWDYVVIPLNPSYDAVRNMRGIIGVGGHLVN